MSVASCTILSNFFEEQCPQSHAQYLSGLSRGLFPTTFLKIAVCGKILKYKQLLGHAFWKENIEDRVKFTLLGSNVLNNYCCLKITTADLRKRGLNIRE